MYCWMLVKVEVVKLVSEQGSPGDHAQTRSFIAEACASYVTWILCLDTYQVLSFSGLFLGFTDYMYASIRLSLNRYESADDVFLHISGTYCKATRRNEAVFQFE